MKKILLSVLCLVGLFSLGTSAVPKDAPNCPTLPDDVAVKKAAPVKTVVRQGTGTQDPLLYSALKIQLAVQLDRKGISLADSRAALAQLDGVTIDGVAADAGVAYPTMPAEKGASGQIIAALIAFLNSPAGQQLMAALIQMLMALIAGGG
jgi:hypothetical protein